MVTLVILPSEMAYKLNNSGELLGNFWVWKDGLAVNPSLNHRQFPRTHFLNDSGQIADDVSLIATPLDPQTVLTIQTPTNNSAFATRGIVPVTLYSPYTDLIFSAIQVVAGTNVLAAFGPTQATGLPLTRSFDWVFPNEGTHHLVVRSLVDGRIASESAPVNVTVVRADVPEVLLSINNYAGVTITGSIGSLYQIDFRSALDSTSIWTALTNLTLPSSPFLFLDPQPSTYASRYYRATLVRP